MKKQAENLVSEHADQADKVVDKGAEIAKDKVGHDEQVDQGASKLKSLFRRNK